MAMGENGIDSEHIIIHTELIYAIRRLQHDGHVDGRDYALFKIATGDNDSGGSSGGSGGGGGCGCLTMIVVILIVYGILKLFGG